MSDEKTIDDGGAAFPQTMTMNGERMDWPDEFQRGGMSLRDWFAGQVASGPQGATRLVGADPAFPGSGSPETGEAWAARMARMTDALIAALKVTP